MPETLVLFRPINLLGASVSLKAAGMYFNAVQPSLGRNKICMAMWQVGCSYLYIPSFPDIDPVLSSVVSAILSNYASEGVLAASTVLLITSQTLA